MRTYERRLPHWDTDAPYARTNRQDHGSGLLVEESPVSGGSDPFGKKIWSLAVKSPDRTFPVVAISLLEGGTFLTDEKIGNLKAVQEQLRALGATNPLAPRPIGPVKEPIGYASVAGLGPGASLIVASVFSADQNYEVQVTILQGSNDSRVKDPLGWAAKVALDVLSVLFR